MGPEITRKRLLKRFAGGAALATAADAALPSASRATVLDQSFVARYPPNPALSYPSSWFLYTALLPHVIEPYDVIVCNRALGPLDDVDGGPDLRGVPDDATSLMLFLYDPVPLDYVKAPIGQAVELSSDRGMQFQDLGSGAVNFYGFRQFLGWHIVISANTLYSIETRVYVGPNAGTEWADVQSIVDSVRVTV